MKRIYTIILTTFLVALFATTGALAQENGDFRSTADGDWSAIAWETYDGANWNATGTVPGATDNVFIRSEDTVSVDADITFTGNITVQGSGADTGGQLAVGTGITVTFGDGGTYDHARDGGSVPVATWSTGSTILFSGIVGNGPDNRDQAFHNITWNNPDQGSNVSLGLGTVTISGTVRVVDTGSNRFRLTDSGSGDGQTITIEGDVLVEGGAVETTGSGSTATYNVVVMGDVVVHDGTTFATSRGSGGQATWTVHGDFTAHSGAELRDSHDGNLSRVVFGGSTTQNISVSDGASYNGAFNYTVATGSDVVVAADSTFQFEDDFSLEGNLTVNGEIAARDTLHVNGGTMTVANGGTYNHAYDAGVIPDATWADGSTILITGVETNDPDNGEQDFYNYTWNNPNQGSNINIGWDDYTLRGSITVLNTNGNQFRLTSADTENPRVITVQGDVIVDGENAEFTATGSGDVADYDITVMGNIEIVNGGFLSVSRGSGGRAVWTLYGDMTINGGEIGDSDIDKHGQTRSFVFAADTASEGVPGQTITANNVSYDSEVYFEVADSSGVLIASGSDFTYEGIFTNYGVVDVAGDATLTFADGATYNHARNGGEIPTAVWAEGSTALITGTEGDSPGNGNQDFYNLTLDTPNISDRGNLEMDGNTIGGNIHVVTTADNRWYLTSPGDTEEDAKEITIMGDVIVEQGAFTTNGSSSPGPIVVQHYGDITVNDANFSISRGSGPLVTWNLHEGSFTFNAGKSQNSDPRNGSAFVFTGEDTVQTFTVGADVDLANLPWTVDSLAYVDMGVSNFGGMSSIIDIKAGATIASADSAAFERNVDAQITTLSPEAHYVINGSEAQKTGFGLPLQVASLTIDNEAGVTQSRGITINEFLKLSAGVFDNTIGITLAEGAEVIFNGGSLLIPMDGIPIGTFALTSPENGFELDLTGDASTEVVMEWETAASGEDITYTWHADSAGGDFSDPLVSIPSDDDGSATTLTLTYQVMDSVVADLGVEEGGDIDLSWTVTAETEDTLRYADESFDINIARKLGVSNENEETLPTEFALSQNYPNPFNPTTTINYDVPEAADVTLKVYDITGREVAQLVNSRKAPGSYNVEWNAQNFATGVYLYRIQAGNFTAVRKLTLIK